MNDKMIPIEELRSSVLQNKTLVECVAFHVKTSVSLPIDDDVLTKKMLSDMEWALQSAEAFLPSELHHEFQMQFLKRWEKYIMALGTCDVFDFAANPSAHVKRQQQRAVQWAVAFLRQNSKQFDDIMNKQRRKDLENIIKCLLGILKLTDKQEVIDTLEQANRDIDLAKDEEEMAKDALPENFYLTERYGDMEDNVSDLYGAIGSVEDILDDVKSLKKYDVSVIKEQVEKVVEDIQKVVDR